METDPDGGQGPAWTGQQVENNWIIEKKTGEDVEGRDLGVIDGTVPAFPLTDTETQ
jgi:hypothetical protein